MNTGRSAFPVPDSHHAKGMTLLDWMAGQALVGLLACPAGSLCSEGNADAAYDYAEAMLAEKARREADHSGGSNKMVPDHSPDARKMVEDHFRDAAKMTELERQNTQLLSLLRQAELAIAFANREPNVIRMLGDDYTEVLQLVRAALKEEKP